MYTDQFSIWEHQARPQLSAQVSGALGTRVTIGKMGFAFPKCFHCWLRVRQRSWFVQTCVKFSVKPHHAFWDFITSQNNEQSSLNILWFVSWKPCPCHRRPRLPEHTIDWLEYCVNPARRQTTIDQTQGGQIILNNSASKPKTKNTKTGPQRTCRKHGQKTQQTSRTWDNLFPMNQARKSISSGRTELDSCQQPMFMMSRECLGVPTFCHSCKTNACYLIQEVLVVIL